MCCKLRLQHLAMMMRFQTPQCYQFPDVISSTMLSGHATDSSFAVLWVVRIVRYFRNRNISGETL